MKARHARWLGLALAVLAATLWDRSARSGTLGSEFTYQGQLNKDGAPLDGSANLRFSLWDAATGGNPVGTTQSLPSHPVTHGLFTAQLDFGSAAFDGDARWLQIEVEGAALTPRQPLTATPYALYALRSLFAVRAEYVSWGGITGIPGGFLDGVDDDTTYSAGDGLQLVGTQFGVDFGGPGLAATASRSDHDHNARYYTQAELSTSGGGGQVHWDNLSGVPNGFADGVDDDTLAGLSAAAGQVAKWDGAQWMAGDDNDTTYTSGDGLSLVGTEFSVNFGGTGNAPWVARSDHDHFGASWTGWSSTCGLAVTNTSVVSDAKALYARASGPTGVTYGVYGMNASTSGRGVCGYASAFEGTTYGVYGLSASPQGYGVYGYAGSAIGANYGVYGLTNSNSGHGVHGSAPIYGVYGETTALDGDAYGVYGQSASDSGQGVYGVATHPSGPTEGVHGVSHSTSGSGVRGYASAGSGTTYGVYGESDSTTGRGVYGHAPAYGVYGKTTSTGGCGVFGHATANSGTTWGVWGSSLSPSGKGVYGVVTSPTGTPYAVCGNANSYAAYDFYAAGLGINYGPFTGGHEVKLDERFPAGAKRGLIVSVTGKAERRTAPDGSVTLSSTLPTVTLACTANDKAVFGVFMAESTLREDHWYKARDGERFGVANALGEGRVWVCDVNGAIEAGDYITTSDVPGYGQKQHDDLLHNYTLGKATETIDWDAVTQTIEFNGRTVKVYLLAVVYTSG